MKYQLKVYSIWEFGQRKDAQGNPHQEDSLYPAFGKQTDADRTFILCDGMGGHDAGEVASATVCEAMAESVVNDGHDSEGEFTDADLQNAIDAAFDALDKVDNGAVKKMGTTMTFLKLHNLGATMAHMGDSRVYHIRPGKTGPETQILHQTEDHSLVNDLVKVGELTPEQARTSRQRNVITRAMQPHMDRRPRADVYKTTDIRPGDFFYLCSDGMLEDPEMDEGITLKNIFSEQVSDDELRVKMLKKSTMMARDNHTAIIVHILDVEGPFPEPESHDSSHTELPAPTEEIDEAIVEEDGPEDDTVTTMPGAPKPAGKQTEKTEQAEQSTVMPPLFNDDKTDAASTPKPAPGQPAKPAPKPGKGAAQTAANTTTTQPPRRPDAAGPTTQPPVQHGKKGSGSNMILIGLIVVFVLAVAGFFVFKQCSGDKKPNVNQETIQHVGSQHSQRQEAAATNDGNNRPAAGTVSPNRRPTQAGNHNRPNKTEPQTAETTQPTNTVTTVQLPANNNSTSTNDQEPIVVSDQSAIAGSANSPDGKQDKQNQQKK